nr:uncharacterized protein LOC111504331 isoform X2 [Leptinotarsa decemlineata]
MRRPVKTKRGELMLIKELQVDVDTTDLELTDILPLMLAFFMKNWQGWQRSTEYHSGTLNLAKWFQKFKRYITVRINVLIKSEFKKAQKMVGADQKGENNTNKSFHNSGTQTEYSVPKVFASFSLSIQCPPKSLHAIVFTESGDDIIVQQHQHPTWAPLSLKELLNWPYIGVEYFSPELSFKRYNRGEYIRYLSFFSPTHVETDNTNFIEQVEILNPSEERNSYTLNLLKTYTNQYLEVIKTMENINLESIENLVVVIEEFLKDIEEIGINNTMATNTSVLFNIGRSAYFRFKKMPKKYHFAGPIPEVCYYEKYIPKMETQLTFFNGIQDTTTDEITFIYPNVLKKNLAANSNAEVTNLSVPVLVFYCLFCEIGLVDISQLTEHLEKEHTMEPDFMCIKCNKYMSVCNLSKTRWKHECKYDKNSKASISKK